MTRVVKDIDRYFIDCLRLYFLPVLILFFGIGILFIRYDLAVLSSVSDAKSIMKLKDYWQWFVLVGLEIVIVHFMLVRKRYDTLLFSLALMLSALGLIELARFDLELFIAQVRWLSLALPVAMLMIIFWQRLRQVLYYPYILGIMCVVLLALPMIFGVESGGSRNWLFIGSFSMQPSELGKIILLFFLASFLSEHRQQLTLPSHSFWAFHLPPFRFIAPLVCLWGASVMMFVVERDLGSALIFFGLAVLLTYIATGRKSYVIYALLFITVSSVLSYYFFSHVRIRFDIWLNPWADPCGNAYQIVQSLFAFGAGGVWGAGFTFGHPEFIPVVHTDFIYSAIAEEWGLIGTLSVLVLYTLITWRGIKWSLACTTSKELLLTSGASLLILLQALIIIGGDVKLIPLTGVTLPFVSYGGSSLIASFAVLALILVNSGQDRDNKRRMCDA